MTVTALPVLEEIRYDPIAGAVTTVGAQQIQDLNAGDPAAALRRVPGLVVSRYNVVGSYGGGDGGGVFARGQGTGRPAPRSRLSVDGIPKFNGVFSHPLLDNVSVDLAEEIDVFKGAQPVLFGNMAFASIDVVSRKRVDEGLRRACERRVRELLDLGPDGGGERPDRGVRLPRFREPEAERRAPRRLGRANAGTLRACRVRPRQQLGALSDGRLHVRPGERSRESPERRGRP